MGVYHGVKKMHGMKRGMEFMVRSMMCGIASYISDYCMIVYLFNFKNHSIDVYSMLFEDLEFKRKNSKRFPNYRKQKP